MAVILHFGPLPLTLKLGLVEIKIILTVIFLKIND